MMIYVATVGSSIAELEREVDLILERQRVLVACFYCLIEKETVCQFGLHTCPWRNRETVDLTTVEGELPGVTGTTDTIFNLVVPPRRHP